MISARYGNELENMRRDLSQLVSSGLTGGSRGGTISEGPKQDGSSRAWVPAVDVTEDESAITIHAELPGMKKEDIDIQLTGETLTLRGERRREDSERGENYHRIERQYGQFLRTFHIETSLDADKVTATYEQGVLTVSLPKQEVNRPRQIAINVRK